MYTKRESELIQQFLQQYGRVQSITTRVDWNDWGLLRSFEKVGFIPARVMNLELTLE